CAPSAEGLQAPGGGRGDGRGEGRTALPSQVVAPERIRSRPNRGRRSPKLAGRLAVGLRHWGALPSAEHSVAQRLTQAQALAHALMLRRPREGAEETACDAQRYLKGA